MGDCWRRDAQLQSVRVLLQVEHQATATATSTLSRSNRASAFILRAMDGPSPKTALAPTYSSRKFLAKKTCTATAVASIAMSDGQATDKTEPATRWGFRHVPFLA